MIVMLNPRLRAEHLQLTHCIPPGFFGRLAGSSVGKRLRTAFRLSISYYMPRLRKARIRVRELRDCVTLLRNIEEQDASKCIKMYWMG